MVIEFKPGIFISARIKGYNLILKNITYVKTENLERLNEALTGNKKITLNEDIQNSFTPENKKEINFSNDFRVEDFYNILKGISHLFRHLKTHCLKAVEYIAIRLLEPN